MEEIITKWEEEVEEQRNRSKKDLEQLDASHTEQLKQSEKKWEDKLKVRDEFA